MRLNVGQLKAHIEETKPFVSFYAKVTQAIYNQLDKSPLKTYVPFMEFLCKGFWDEYVNWKNPLIIAFLQQVHSKAVRPLEVACQAYLHMAYDLPRVIAKELLAGRAPNTLEARTFFYTFDDVFDNPLEEQFRDFKSVGLFALIRLPRKFSLSKIAAIWVHSIRARSFHHGEVLEQVERQVSSTQRELVETNLRIYVTNTAVNVLSTSRWNPVSWLRLLKSPSITISFAPQIAVFLMPTITRANGLYLAIIIISIIGIYIGLAYFGLLRMIARLGSEISQAAEAVIEGAKLRLPRGFPRDEVQKQL